jgi:putative oligomerization/nucleic acid binding protein
VRKLTSQGERAVADLSTRYGVSADAVRAMLDAVRLGNGTMAQFSHPEFGGSGQWMAGGMTMVGDMFNHRLQATVSGLASELSSLLASTSVYAPAPDPVAAAGPGPVHQANLDSWWPGELGRPGSSGSQDNSRYAVFPQASRLAVQIGGGPVCLYDTLDHVIGGVQQQQGGLPGRLSFASQHGTFAVESLPLAGPAQTTPPARGPAAPPERAPSAGTDADAVLAALERLGDLHQRGILTDEEFAAKKTSLLSRL